VSPGDPTKIHLPRCLGEYRLRELRAINLFGQPRKASGYPLCRRANQGDNATFTWYEFSASVGRAHKHLGRPINMALSGEWRPNRNTA